MKKDDINPGDWPRILFGEAPLEFLVEVFIRTTIVYLVLLIIVRMMGKRMSGQLTIAELSIMVTMGAIVAPAMQIPQLGVLMGIMILVCALVFQKGINWAEFKSHKFEEVSQGKVSTLVEDGIIRLDYMNEAKVSRQQLFSTLRSEKVFNLGEVSRVYLEACGIFSIYKKEEPVAGLQIFPSKDQGINSFDQELCNGQIACTICGNVADESQIYQSCEVCNSINWISATISISKKD